MAYRWQDVFEFRHVTEEAFKRIAGHDAIQETGPRVLLYPGAGAKLDAPMMNIPVPQSEDAWTAALQQFAQPIAPVLTTRNYEVLCRSSDETRNYCLVVYDA